MITLAESTNSSYAAALGQLGRITHQSAEATVKEETGRLIRALVDSVPPDSLQVLKRNISRDVRRVFYPLSMNNARSRQMIRDSKGKMVWFLATKHRILGVTPLRFHADDTISDATHLIYRAKMPKQKSTVVGARGGRELVSVNRLLIKRKVYGELLKKLSDAGGRMKAAWAAAWGYLQPKGRSLPAWVKRHVGKTTRGTFAPTISPTMCRMVLINRSPGVEGDKSIAAVQGVMKSRAIMVAENVTNMIEREYNRSVGRRIIRPRRSR